METIDKVNGLDAAIRLIRSTRIKNDMASGAHLGWLLMEHAIKHLDAQVNELMQPTPTDALMADLKASIAEQTKGLTLVPPVSRREWTEEDESLYRSQAGLALTLRQRWTENRRRRAAWLPEIDAEGREIQPQRDYRLQQYLEQLRIDAAFAKAAWDQMVEEIKEGYRTRTYHG